MAGATQGGAADDLEVRFTHHPPRSEAELSFYEANREAALDRARWLESLLPPSRELSLALTKLEEFVMWSNAAVARRGLRDDESRPL